MRGWGGTPDQWYSEATQAQEKVMVFCLLHGSGKKFGPFFHEADENINQFNYRSLLQKKVFPQMKRVLGQDKFDTTVWQQDGAKPHQTKLTKANYSRMLAFVNLHAHLVTQHKFVRNRAKSWKLGDNFKCKLIQW